MIKTLYTNDVAISKCNNCRDPGEEPTKVSNLLRDPQMNGKYDDAWFLKNNP